MADVKSISLPEPYLSMYEDLKARGEFDRAHGGFSSFIQDKIEEFHKNPQRVRAEHHKEQEEKHRKIKEALSDKLEDFDEDQELGEEEEKEFFQEFLDRLKKKKGSKEWHDNSAEAYKSLENGWIRKYSNQFTSVRKEEFRERFLELIDQDKIEEDLEIEVGEFFEDL